jgi:hypothetical protein
MRGLPVDVQIVTGPWRDDLALVLGRVRTGRRPRQVLRGPGASPVVLALRVPLPRSRASRQHDVGRSSVHELQRLHHEVVREALCRTWRGEPTWDGSPTAPSELRRAANGPNPSGGAGVPVAGARLDVLGSDPERPRTLRRRCIGHSPDGPFARHPGNIGDPVPRTPTSRAPGGTGPWARARQRY